MNYANDEERVTHNDYPSYESDHVLCVSLK